MAIILKVHCEDVLRRALLKGRPNYAAINLAVQEVWPHHGMQNATYIAENGDLQALTEEAFPDFLGTGKATTAGMVLELSLVNAPTIPGTEQDRDTIAIDDFDTPWQHVEQGSELGDDNFYTVIDLTDMQEEHSNDAAGSTRDASTAGADSPDMSDAQNEEDSAPAAEEERKDAQAAETEAHHNFEQRIDIVIAAFDEGQEGCLSFKDCTSLLNAACGDGGELPRHTFDQMCMDVGANPMVGLDREALMCIYCCGNPWMALDRDFDAATKKLQGSAPVQGT